MATQSFRYGVLPHLYRVTGTGTSTFGGANAGQRVATIFFAPKTGTIRKIHATWGAIGASPGARASLQDVTTATGFPDGTEDQLVTGITPAGTTRFTIDFGAGTGRSVTVGDRVAFVVENTGTTGNFFLSSGNTTFSENDSQNVYGAVYNGASWAKLAQVRNPVLLAEYDDGSIVPIAGCIPEGPTALAFAANTAGADEYGHKLILTAPLRVAGAVVYGNAAAGDYDVVLYDASNNVLGSFSHIATCTAGSNQAATFCPFTQGEIDLAATTYRLTLKPTTNTSITAYYFDFGASNSARRAGAAGGGIAQLTKRVDAGSWTDVDTQLLACLGLQLVGMSDAAGGGVLLHSGMGGGMNA